MTENLITIDALVQLFWDYSDDDLKNLRRKSEDFAYVWDTYVLTRDKEQHPQTYSILWELWLMKFSNETKALLIDYARQRYGDEKRRGLEQQGRLKAIVKGMPDEP